MREWGSVINTAMNDPKKLDQIRVPEKQKRNADPGEWETQKWW